MGAGGLVVVGSRRVDDMETVFKIIPRGIMLFGIMCDEGVMG